MNVVFRWHNILTNSLFIIGVSAISFITAIYCFEIVARYFFRSPTGWANDAASFLFSVGIFMCLPRVTQDRGHVAVTLIFHVVSDGIAKRIAATVAFSSALICLVAAVITGHETVRQVTLGILTNSSIGIPKWWITIWMPYAFFSSGLYFLRGWNYVPKTDED